jgi:hypothetical protein
MRSLTSGTPSRHRDCSAKPTAQIAVEEFRKFIDVRLVIVDEKSSIVGRHLFAAGFFVFGEGLDGGGG